MRGRFRQVPAAPLGAGISLGGRPHRQARVRAGVGAGARGGLGAFGAEASTLQVAGVTAWNSLFAARPVDKGDLVVVIGSGGVALYAAQLSLALGADVIAAVRHDADDARWPALGITDVISTDPGWGERLAARTGGASKVVDSVGPGHAAESLAALRGSGEVAMPGLRDLTSPAIDLMSMIGKQSSLCGVAVGSAGMHRALAAFMAEHDLHPILDTVTPFADLPAAYATQAAPGIFGKVVVEVSEHA